MPEIDPRTYEAPYESSRNRECDVRMCADVADRRFQVYSDEEWIYVCSAEHVREAKNQHGTTEQATLF